MNKALLKSVMALHGDTAADLADCLGLSPQSVYSKTNETKLPSGRNAEFSQGEIRAIRDRYNLTADQVEAIFFS